MKWPCPRLRKISIIIIYNRRKEREDEQSYTGRKEKDTKWREAADVHGAFDIIGSGVPGWNI